MRRASLASLSALDLTEKEAAKPLSIGHGGGMSALLCVFFAAVAISDELQGCFAAGIRGTCRVTPGHPKPAVGPLAEISATVC